MAKKKLDKPIEGQLCYALAPMLYATEDEALKWAAFLQGEGGSAADSMLTLVRVELMHAGLFPVGKQIVFDESGRPVEVLHHPPEKDGKKKKPLLPGAGVTHLGIDEGG